MKFCSECGHTVTIKTPSGDHLPRFVCERCETIHYRNPRVITGTVPIAPDGRILLCRRNIEPRRNYWTLPAGFMENGETTVQGALRETMEESCVAGNNPQLLSVISLPAFDQVHMFYQIDMPDFSFSTTPESNDVQLYEPNNLPWSDIAFRTVERTLKHYLHLQTAPFEVLNDHIEL